MKSTHFSFNCLPQKEQQQVIHYLMSDNFKAAKAIYDRYQRETVQSQSTFINSKIGNKVADQADHYQDKKLILGMITACLEQKNLRPHDDYPRLTAHQQALCLQIQGLLNC